MKRPTIRSAVMLVLALVLADTAAAAEEYAVFRSTDRGRSWIRADSGMPARSRVNAFGSKGEVLFAGTDAGIFISGDGARSWRPATGAAMSSGRILSFATLGREVFACADGGGVLVSADDGGSWRPAPALPSKKVRCLLFHQKRLHAGTDADGVFVLDSDRQVWTPLWPGLPALAQVFAMSVVEGRLFAALYSKGLYVWDKQEDHWTKVANVSPLALAAVDGALVAGHNPGGLYWSGDLGASWSKGVAAGHAFGPLAALNPVDPGALPSEAPVWELGANDEGLAMAGAADGIYYSTDRGRTWERTRAGLPERSPGIAFLANRDLVLAGVMIPENDSRRDGR